MFILTWLLQFLGGGILQKVMDIFGKQLDATTERQRIEAGVVIEHVKAEIERRKNATQIRLATAGYWEMRVLTFLIAAPFVLHAGAVGLATTFSLGWGIPAYPAPFDEWEGRILLSFFGVTVAAQGIKAVASAIASRR